MGVLSDIKDWLTGKPDQQTEPEPQAVEEPAPQTQGEPPLELADKPGADSPFDRMRAADFQLSPDNPDYDAFAAARNAEPAVSETAEVAAAVDEGEQGGRFGENKFDPPDVEPEKPGQWIPGPVGPGGSRGMVFVPAQGEQQQEGPAVERAGPDPGDCPTFEDRNPEPDIDGMDL